MSAETIATEPHLSSKFDIIVASSVCSFLPNYAATLRELTHIMQPGAIFAQWDWLADMPAERIRNAFAAAGLVEQKIAEAFVMASDGEAMPVIIGIGRLTP